MTRLSGQNYLVLARSINAAALDPSGWKTVVRTLSEMVGGVRTHFYGYDLQLEQSGPSHYSHGYDPDFLTLFHRNFQGRNVWAPAFARGLPGRVLTAEEMYPGDALLRTEFYADWVRPQEDMRAGAGGVLIRDAARSYMIGGNIRSRDAEQLEPLWSQLLGDAMPLLQQALLMNRTLAGVHLNLHLSRQQVDAERAAVIVMTDLARVVSADLHAAELIEAGSPLRICANGALSLADPRAEARLAAVRKQARHTAPQSFPLRDPQDRLWRCNVAALSEESELAAVLGQAYLASPPLIVLALSRDAPPDTPETRLAARLGLTRSEAAVALMLADGLNPDEIAQRRGTRTVTVRNQIKQALAKTESRRQLDLVRKVLCVTGPISPPDSPPL